MMLKRFQRSCQFVIILGAALAFYELVNHSPLASTQITRLNTEEIAMTNGHLLLRDEEDANPGRKEIITGRPHVLFNALPKTGSRTLNSVALNIAIDHGMRVENTMALENETIRNKIERIVNDTRPTFVYSHLPYYEIQAGAKPVYVSIVRDPIDRIVSLYYFKVFGDSTKSSSYREQMERMNFTKETFDECFSKHGVCVANGIFSKNVQQYCGIEPDRQFPSARTCLERAKRIIKDKYLLVGIMEDYDGFLKVLERLLPDIFDGATKYYQSLSYMNHFHKTETLNKTGPSERVRRELRSELKLEYELYNFIKHEFEKLKSQLGISN